MPAPVTWFIDANSLQAMINSGQYRILQIAAEAQGIRFATTQTVLDEMRLRGQPSAAAVEFYNGASSRISVIQDPFGKIDVYNPSSRDAGERGLARLSEIEIAAGREATIVTQDGNAIRGQFIRNSAVAAARDIQVRSIGEIDPRFVETNGAFRPVPDALSDLFPANGSGYAQARDAFLDAVARSPGDSGISLQTRFETNGELGQEVYVRSGARYGDVPERTYRPSGSPPPEGSGWQGGREARSLNPQISDLHESNANRVRELIRNIRDDAASYGTDGTLTPDAELRMQRAYAGGLTVATSLGLADSVTTGQRAAELIRQGKTHEAQNEIAGLAGRLFGGLWGAELGAGVALAFGVSSPVGLIAAALFYGVIGTDIGNNIAIAASQWLPDIFGPWFSNRDPLVLSLTGDHVSLTALATSNAYFDLNNDGLAERTGWIARGEALLALDGNHNGRIDGGAELFGNATQTGFEVLAAYDDNRDGQITSADAVWSQLLLWRDANGDGVSSADELSPISASAVTAINLHPRTPAQGEARAGNPLLKSMVQALMVGYTRLAKCQLKCINTTDMINDNELICMAA